MTYYKRTYIIFSILLSIFIGNHSIFAQNKYNGPIITGLNAEAFQTPFGGGMNACQFGAIDLNIDGIDDLVVFDRQGNRIMPYINGGTAGTIDYTLAPEYVKELPELFHWVIFAFLAAIILYLFSLRRSFMILRFCLISSLA